MLLSTKLQSGRKFSFEENPDTNELGVSSVAAVFSISGTHGFLGTIFEVRASVPEIIKRLKTQLLTNDGPGVVAVIENGETSFIVDYGHKLEDNVFHNIRGEFPMVNVRYNRDVRELLS